MVQAYGFHGEETGCWTGQRSTGHPEAPAGWDGSRSQHSKTAAFTPDSQAVPAGVEQTSSPFHEQDKQTLMSGYCFQIVLSAESIPRKLKDVPWKGSGCKDQGTSQCPSCTKVLRRCHKLC